MPLLATPRWWDGGTIVARRGRQTLSIAVKGGVSLARRRRRRWEDLAPTTSKRSVGSGGQGGDNDREATITTIQQSALRWRQRRGWRATNSAMAARAMATTKRVAGERRRRRRRGRWRWQRGRRVTKRAMVRAARVMATPTKRAMAAATRVAGDEEGDGEGGKSDGDAYKEGDGGGDEGGGRQRGRWRGRQE